MLKNYIRIAWRNLRRNTTSTLINISGLAVGMAVALLTGLWLYDELSFNRYHENYDRIAKVAIHNTGDDGASLSPTLSWPLAQELGTNYHTQFKRLARASFPKEVILSAGDQKVSRTGQYMEEAAPDIFSLKMIKGSRAGLHDPHSILLSASTAEALFGAADPINQLVLINNKSTVKVTGVYKDLPLNTELNTIKFMAPFALWVSENDWIKRTENDWTNHYLKLFAEINPGADFQAINRRIENIELDQIRHIDEENYRNELAENPRIMLQPMADWHLNKTEGRNDPKTSLQQMIWMVSLIGGFVLLLACINFMNLSTARSGKRTREVGIRKAIGSLRSQLVVQFFCESLAIVALSFVCALLLTTLSLDWFNQLAGKEMHMPWASPFFWIVSLVFILITGLIAGSYPALFLSSFKPIKALKGSLNLGRESAIPRKALVVFQFTVSVVLINCTMIVLRQVQHAKDRPTGYDREGLLMMRMKSNDFYGKYDVIRTSLLNTGVVSEFAQSMGKVTEIASGNDGFDWQGRDVNKKQDFGTLAISADYGKTIGWQFSQGRDFSREFGGDSLGLIINEAAMREMGLKNPIGMPISWTWKKKDVKVINYTIIGVVKDMVMASPYEKTRPVVFYQKGHNGDVNWMILKVKPGIAMSKALPKIEAAMKSLIPTAPFDYKFADEDYALKFITEERISKLAGFFAILAIFISCLGLFGLASFMAEQRTKEVGIRKVLGASVLNVWSLLSKEFVLLVTIALVAAIPIAWYAMHNWLQHYTYRTDISQWIFLLSATGALAITLATISFQALKAATMNPVKSLRME